MKNLLIFILSLVYSLSNIAYSQNAKKPTIMVVPSDNWCVQNGYVQTYNKYQEPTAYIGSNRDMDGVIVLKDRYGALGYTQSGKKWK